MVLNPSEEDESGRKRGIIKPLLLDQFHAALPTVATSKSVVDENTTNTPLIFDTLCEGNMIRNNSAGFDLKKTFSFAIRGTNYENRPKPVDDQGYDTAILPVNPDLLHSLAKTNKPSAKE